MNWESNSVKKQNQQKMLPFKNKNVTIQQNYLANTWIVSNVYRNFNTEQNKIFGSYKYCTLVQYLLRSINLAKSFVIKYF